LQVPNLMSLFRCLGRTKVSIQVQGFVCEYFVTKIRFHSEEWRTTPCRLATLYIGGSSSIHNLRTLHAVVTGTHLSHGA
jgi:hypothetical protein